MRLLSLEFRHEIRSLTSKPLPFILLLSLRQRVESRIVARPKAVLVYSGFLPGWIPNKYVEAPTLTQEHLRKRYWKMEGRDRLQDLLSPSANGILRKTTQMFNPASSVLEYCRPQIAVQSSSRQDVEQCSDRLSGTFCLHKR